MCRLYLFYSALGSRNGKAFESRYQIGAAALELDGKTARESLMDESVHFVKNRDPLLPFNLEKTHHDNNTQEPSALWKDGRIELFHVGLKLKKPAESVTAAGQEITDVAIYRALFDKELNSLEPAKDALPYPALFTPAWEDQRPPGPLALSTTGELPSRACRWRSRLTWKSRAGGPWKTAAWLPGPAGLIRLCLLLKKDDLTRRILDGASSCRYILQPLPVRSTFA
jgi:hypothetical protein